MLNEINEAIPAFLHNPQLEAVSGIFMVSLIPFAIFVSHLNFPFLCIHLHWGLSDLEYNFQQAAEEKDVRASSILSTKQPSEKRKTSHHLIALVNSF